jgi:hypothetical protein
MDAFEKYQIAKLAIVPCGVATRVAKTNEDELFQW